MSKPGKEDSKPFDVVLELFKVMSHTSTHAQKHILLHMYGTPHEHDKHGCVKVKHS
jgi:hypothetical protein